MDGLRHLFYKDVLSWIFNGFEIWRGFGPCGRGHLASMKVLLGAEHLALVAAALNPRIKQILLSLSLSSDFRRIYWNWQYQRAYDELFRWLIPRSLSTKRRMRLFRRVLYRVKNMAPHSRERADDNRTRTCLLSDYPVCDYNRLECAKEHHLMPEYNMKPLVSCQW